MANCCTCAQSCAESGAPADDVAMCRTQANDLSALYRGCDPCACRRRPDDRLLWEILGSLHRQNELLLQVLGAVNNIAAILLREQGGTPA